MKALFFDTETTGFGKARLVQLGAILQDTDTGRILSEFNGMVITEGIEIPEQAAAVHGITNDLADAYGFKMEFVDSLFGMMLQDADLVVAHNIQYDLGIVEHNLPVSWGLMKDKEQFCTMLATIDVVAIPGRYGKNKWPKLMESYVFYFNEEFDGAHDAMADVRACRDVYVKLIENAN